MQRKTTFAVGEYYHLYSRGVEKRDIFLDAHDRERFMRLLYIANGKNSFEYRNIQNKSLGEIDRGEALTAIGAYVLMPNHFHLLVRESREGGMTKYLRGLLTGYSSYFNKRHNRVGSLFQSRFKAEHVNRDEYLRYLFAYIHLNPVKLIEPEWKEVGIQNSEQAEKFLRTYRYSSYNDYGGRTSVVREEAAILSPELFPEYFVERRDFDNFVHEWLNYKTS